MHLLLILNLIFFSSWLKEADSTVQKQQVDNDNLYRSNEKREPFSKENDMSTSGFTKENVVQPARRPPLLPTPTPLLQTPTPLLPTPNILTDLMKNTAIDKLLSTIRYGPPVSGLPNTTPVTAPVQTENAR